MMKISRVQCQRAHIIGEIVYELGYERPLTPEQKAEVRELTDEKFFNKQAEAYDRMLQAINDALSFMTKEEIISLVIKC